MPKAARRCDTICRHSCSRTSMAVCRWPKGRCRSTVSCCRRPTAGMNMHPARCVTAACSPLTRPPSTPTWRASKPMLPLLHPRTGLRPTSAGPLRCSTFPKSPKDPHTICKTHDAPCTEIELREVTSAACYYMLCAMALQVIYCVVSLCLLFGLISAKLGVSQSKDYSTSLGNMAPAHS